MSFQYGEKKNNTVAGFYWDGRVGGKFWPQFVINKLTVRQFRVKICTTYLFLYFMNNIYSNSRKFTVLFSTTDFLLRKPPPKIFNRPGYCGIKGPYLFSQHHLHFKQLEYKTYKINHFYLIYLFFFKKDCIVYIMRNDFHKRNCTFIVDVL